MGVQEIIVFIIVLLCGGWIVYRKFIKKKNSHGCDSCSAECPMRNMMQQKQKKCGNFTKK